MLTLQPIEVQNYIYKQIFCFLNTSVDKQNLKEKMVSLHLLGGLTQKMPLYRKLAS